MHTCIGILYNENNYLVYMLCYTRGCWKVISPTHFLKKSEQILWVLCEGLLGWTENFPAPFCICCIISLSFFFFFFYPFYFNWNVLEIFLKNSYFICDQYWWLKYENNSLLNLWFEAWMLLIFQVKLTIVHWVVHSFYLGPLMFCNFILSKISWNYSYACISFLLEEFLLDYIIIYLDK